MGNVAGEPRNRLSDGPCVVCPTNLGVRVSREGLYAYPDVVVVCEGPTFTDERYDTLTNPGLIVKYCRTSRLVTTVARSSNGKGPTPRFASIY